MLEVDAEEVDEEVGRLAQQISFSFIDLLHRLICCQVQNMWRTAYKLTKVFGHPDYKGPLRCAATIKAKLEKFKINLPLIRALCNPGMKERHWEASLSSLTAP